MSTRLNSVHVATIIRKYKGKVYKTHLLRRTYRQGKKVLHETLGNLTRLPETTIDLIRRSLKGEEFVSTKDAFRTLRSLPHGHVEAIVRMIRKLGLDTLLASKPSRERDLVLAMIVQQILFPCSKLATTRDWHTTTLAAELHVADADEDELYAALDWLLAHQRSIEVKLAKRHLVEGGLVLYDVSSSYYEGRTCSLACFGHNRDGKKGRPIIVYGMLTDACGRPVAIEVYPGNKGDPKRVRAHVLLCMLAYYVQWHLKRAWESLLFEEEDMQTIRNQRAPVAPAEPSAKVQEKKVTHKTANGLPAQSFATLLRELGTRSRNTCLVVSDPSGHTFDQVTDMTPLQAEAFRLLDL